MAKRKNSKKPKKAPSPKTRLKKLVASRPRSQVATGKRVARYRDKLKALRQISDRFDAKKLDKLIASKPRTKATKAARAKALRSIASTYKRVHLYLAVPHKIVKVRGGKSAKKNLEELRKYSGFLKLKGLRGVPIETYHPKKLRVRFDKQHRPTIAHKGGGSHKLFRFPHMPRSGGELIAFVEKMLEDKILPQGFYALATRHRFLIGGGSFIAERDALLGETQAFVEQYQLKDSGRLITLIYGLKWIGKSDEAVFKRLRETRDERLKFKNARERAKAEQAARASAAMDRYFKGTQAEKNLGLPSAHARGEAWKGAKTLADTQHIVKLSRARDSRKKLSDRARKTGRR